MALVSSESGSCAFMAAPQPGRFLAGNRHRLLLGKAECHKEGGIIDVDLHILSARLQRFLQRQGEVEREHGLVEIDPIVDGRLERQWVCRVAQMHEGKKVKLLERCDIHLGERLEFLLGVDPVTVGIEASSAIAV